MKKILSILPFFFLFFTVCLIAQPTFIHETQIVTRGETFCLEVKTKDFTNILTVKKTFMWDPKVIRFTGVNKLPFAAGVSGFPATIRNDFDDSAAADDGKLAWDWEDASPAGFTISDVVEDNYVLFEMCFEAIGTFGKSTEIMTATDPTPIVTRSGTGGINIGCYSVNGLIGTDVLPVKFTLNDPEPNQGDFFDVEVTVDNFFEIGTAQFTIEFDPAVAEINGIGVSNANLPGWDPPGNVFSPMPGIINFLWFSRDQQAKTLADGTIAFTINLRAIGDCDDYSFIKITGNSTPLKITSALDPDTNAGTNISAVVCDGLARIQPCNQTGGITLTEPDCPEVMRGETVCVKVLASGFDDLTEADFLIKFNPAILRYTGRSFPSAFQPNLDDGASNIGTLGVKWKSRTPTVGLTVPDGSEIIELCFEVIGDGTVDSPISFTGSPNPYFTVRGSNSNVGMVAVNGCVRVKAPPGLTLSADDYEAFKGEQVCVDVTGANFSEINELAFSINYAANVVEFNGVVQNILIDGMTASNFTDLGGGNIGVNWNARLFGETYADGEVLFTICFTVIGDPILPPRLPNCSLIEFSGDPVDVNIINDNSGFNIGLTSNQGNICVKDPGAFTVSGTEVEGNFGEQVCVDVDVVNCNEITSFQFSTNWNSGPNDPIADFCEVQVTGAIPGFTQSNFDFGNTALGLLTVSWNDNNNPITLPDGETIFKVCFKIIGPPLLCTDFSFDENPLPVYVTSALSGATDIGLTGISGEICAKDYFRIQEAVVLDEGCPNSNTGSIFLNTRGGTAPYNYSWDNGITANSNDIQNLASGTYRVTMTDSGTPQITVIDSFEIVVSGTAPMADAGESKSLNCNNLPVILDGTASSAGSEISYQWTTVDGGLVSPSDETASPRVTAEGTYVLEVLNTRTQCVSYDTVIVTPPVSDEGADAGVDQLTDCYDETARLDGTNSVGDNLRYSWAAISGTLDPATDSIAIATALTAGTFELTVRNTETGCEGRDTVKVFQDDIPPTADAGPDMSIPCRADTVTIGGTATTAMNVTYEWTRITDGNIISRIDESAAQVNAAGVYELLVIDTLNGCSHSDLVEVIGDPNRPVADAGEQIELDCRKSSAVINSTGSSQNGPFNYTWEAFAGGEINPSETSILQPTVTKTGRYQLTVRNAVTGCESFSSVNVISDVKSPVAFAGADFEFQCAVIPIQLDGSGSSVTDTSRVFGYYEYSWSNDDPSTVIQDPNALTTTANGAGTYILLVRDTTNGCVSRDTMIVTQDTISSQPIAMIQAPTQMITCVNEEVTLNAIGSDNGAGFTIVWAPPGDIISGITTLTPTVNAAGVYRLTVFNDSTSCATTREVEVLSERILPVASVLRDSFELPCDPAEVQISGIGSDSGPGIAFNWTHPTPGAIDNPALIQPIVTEAGVYTLVVTNTMTGCFSDTTLVVYPTPTSIVADAGDDLQLDCANDEFDITGGNSSTDPAYDFSWVNKLTGDTVSTTLDWTVRDSGTYVLTIRDDKGCFAFNEMYVDANNETPDVSTGGPQDFSCSFTDAQLSGSFDAGMATDITATWSSPDGNPISDPNSPTPTVTEAGTYIYTVLNNDNGCSSFAETVISVNGANLTDATADFDAGMCDDFAMLNANLPTDVMGIWTTASGVVLDDPTNPMILVSDLPNGSTQFTWTLSTTDCPDYSSSTVDVTISSAASPTLRNDVILMDGDSTTIDVDFVRNDDIDAGSNWSITLLDTVPVGAILSQTNGGFIYEKEDGYDGEFDLTYEVCNLDCPDRCDTAFIKIRVRPNVIDEPEEVPLPPNAITPNGDGLNETLVFEQLETSREEYPDRELTVFNRWGDIVYKARPYNNDWAGTGRNGKNLPQATYYYILRLNVAEGDIIRGDVTILK